MIRQLTIIGPEVPNTDLLRGLQDGRYTFWVGKKEDGEEFYVIVEKDEKH